MINIDKTILKNFYQQKSKATGIYKIHKYLTIWHQIKVKM